MAKVPALVILHVSFSVERLSTVINGTGKLFSIQMDAPVYLQILFLAKSFLAAGILAPVRLSAKVQVTMSIETHFSIESLVTAWKVAGMTFLR